MWWCKQEEVVCKVVVEVEVDDLARREAVLHQPSSLQVSNVSIREAAMVGVTIGRGVTGCGDVGVEVEC